MKIKVNALNSPPYKSLFYLNFCRICKNKISVISLAIIGMLVLMAIFGPIFAPNNPFKISLIHRLEPPSFGYIFGTDNLGRCIFSRILYGSRWTLLAGTIAVLIGVAFGTFLGLLAGYLQGWIEKIIMIFIDLLLSLPYLILVVVLTAILGPSLRSAMIAIGIWTIPYYARVIRSQTLTLKKAEFVEAATMAGENNISILLRYILPNCISQIIVLSTNSFAQAILMTAALGFLGLGAQPPLPEWGAMTAIGKEYVYIAPQTLFFPAFFICLNILAFNFLGDGLRDILDPRMRGM